jgi:hypothetical protein
MAPPVEEDFFRKDYPKVRIQSDNRENGRQPHLCWLKKHIRSNNPDV